MDELLNSAQRKKDNIANSDFTIYSPIEIGDTELWYTSSELTSLLTHDLVGKSFGNVAIRTRSKVAKSHICTSLGYPIPKSFTKQRPRFSGQRLDIYVQTANNLQVWNDELEPDRRYVIIKPDIGGIIRKIKVITGTDLAFLDTTGTLTQKYQARLVPGNEPTELISKKDTDNLLDIVEEHSLVNLSKEKPTSDPEAKNLLSIQVIYSRLKGIVGKKFKNAGILQERNRGGELHKIVSAALGYESHRDDGQFPDVKHQLLEIKLQTSTTIDLGLVTPDSLAALDVEQINSRIIRHCDVRYAIFSATIQDEIVSITNFYLTTGQDFFKRFPQFGGRKINKKLQIPLPKDFFTE